MLRVIVRRCLLAAFLAFLAAPAAQGQGFLHKLKDKAKQKVDEHTDQAAQAAVDQADAAVTCTVTDRDCIQQAQASGQPVRVTDADGHPVSGADSAAAVGGPGRSAEAAPPGAGVWLNYDFVPGDKVLFYDDFAGDQVGDLPKHEDVTDGNVTVVDIGAHKYVRTVEGASFIITLPEVLPSRFTIEATYHISANAGHPLTITLGEDHRLSFEWYLSNGAIGGEGPNGQKRSSQDASGIGPNDLVTLRAMVDGNYAKLYINDQRLAQLNGLVFDRDNKIRVELPSTDAAEGGSILTDIRVAEGGKPLYQALAATGRVSTHGILFASGSATIEGESTPTLKEITDMLQAHPDLKLMIEGHTDNQGTADGNLTLSEQRAAAVKSYLVSRGIDGARLSTRGYGQARPVASNDTAEGRQQNRRVELVKM